MFKYYKKFTSFLLSLILLWTGVLGNVQINAHQQVREHISIILENGQQVTEEELLELLKNHSGKIIQLEKPVFQSVPKKRRRVRSLAISPQNILKLMAGTWYIPGIGKIVVVGGTILIGGMVIGGWLKDQIENWLRERANHENEYDYIEDNLDELKGNDIKHIDAPHHDWNRFISGSPNGGPNRWEKIKRWIRKVLRKGKELPYKDVYQKVLRYEGKDIVVTYKKDGNKYLVSNGWIAK